MTTKQYLVERRHSATGATTADTVLDELAVEEPLEIRVEQHSIAVTMRTPGHDRELAAGFLLTERIIEDADDLTGLGHLSDNVVRATLAAGVDAHRTNICLLYTSPSPRD